MGSVNANATAEAARERMDGDICFIRIDRLQANNTISDRLVREITAILDAREHEARIVVLEGSPEIFCLGADFQAISAAGKKESVQDAEALYGLWLRLAYGPYVTIAHVRGRVNAGGVGFVAACDLVLCEARAVFSLSEMLFGLIPACVLPFLIRRMGFARAHYMTLMTQPISGTQAAEWGLVNAADDDSDNLLRRHLLRLRPLAKKTIARYKRYLHAQETVLHDWKAGAIECNEELFSDPTNLENISRYVNTGRFPWEK